VGSRILPISWPKRRYHDLAKAPPPSAPPPPSLSPRQVQLAAQGDEERSGRGRVILLPTLAINTDQYRGALTPPAVLRALCSGFQEGRQAGAGWGAGVPQAGDARAAHAELDLGEAAPARGGWTAFRPYPIRCGGRAESSSPPPHPASHAQH
jgi:hypothetical protein